MADRKRAYKKFRRVCRPAGFQIIWKQVNFRPFCFADYDNALRRKGFQLGFIDVECDEYVIFVHRTADRDKAEDAVQRIGYRYREVADLAI